MLPGKSMQMMTLSAPRAARSSREFRRHLLRGSLGVMRRVAVIMQFGSRHLGDGWNRLCL